MKRTILSILAVFITWSILDFIIHGILLVSTYEATSHLWRPMEEMSAILMHFVTLVFATCFVAIYALLVSDKSPKTGLQYGLLFGLATGASMGFGSYAYMPIPICLALSWFIACFAEVLIAGLLVGLINKEQ